MSNPAKSGANQVKIGLAVLNFRTGVASSPRAVDHISFFGFCSSRACGCHILPGVGVSAMSGESQGRINEMQDERMGEVRRERWNQMG